MNLVKENKILLKLFQVLQNFITLYKWKKSVQIVCIIIFYNELSLKVIWRSKINNKFVSNFYKIA